MYSEVRYIHLSVFPDFPVSSNIASGPSKPPTSNMNSSFCVCLLLVWTIFSWTGLSCGNFEPICGNFEEILLFGHVSTCWPTVQWLIKRGSGKYRNFFYVKLCNFLDLILVKYDLSMQENTGGTYFGQI